MSINFDNWEGTITLTASAAVAVGDVLVEGDTIAVAMTSAAASGDIFTARVYGRVNEVTAFADDAIAVGAIVYWDATNTRLTTTASTHKRAGRALSAKAGSTAGTVDLWLGS